MAFSIPAVFIDANMVLDVLLPDRPRAKAVETFLFTSPVAISELSIHLAVHFGQKFGLTAKEIEQATESLTILPLDDQSIRWAFRNMQTNDFEDAAQVAVAVTHGCRKFLTFDNSLISKYSAFIQIESLGQAS